MWSRLIEVMTPTWASTTFVASNRPPKPTSMVWTSTRSRLKHLKAMPVRNSNSVTWLDSRAEEPPSLRGQRSSTSPAKTASVTGVESRLMRSRKVCRWGEE